ncbi:MAG: nucleoside monophosphate kinase [bacterium]|nr:nucleoside monophosphate kinase [bacterium]
MELQTLIFLGPSGSGKGTQTQLLKQYIEEHDLVYPIFALETGAAFRNFIKGDSYSSQIERDVMARGIRAPDFLAIYLWAELLVKDFTHNDQHFLIDGSPRSLTEAVALKTAMEFYQRRKPTVVHFSASREWSVSLMSERGRLDDTIEDIHKRLDWYERDVVPAVDFYRNDPLFTFVEINAEQPIEAVHRDIIEKLALV